MARGGLDAWVTEALQILNLPQSYAPGLKKIIMAESGGNPLAVNTWDSNARRGTPSRGLMQTIPSTYRHYVHPRVAHRPITDPVANITAGVRYMIDNYGEGTLRAGGRTQQPRWIHRILIRRYRAVAVAVLSVLPIVGIFCRLVLILAQSG